MASASPIRWLPSGVLLVTLALAAYHRFVYSPLARDARAHDKEVTALWEKLVSTNRDVRACRGLTVENYAQRLTDLRTAITNLQSVQELARKQIEIDSALGDRMARSWQLIDFQNERMQQAGQLLRLGKQQGVAFDPAAIAGLPEHSVDLPEPRLLWPRLQMANHLLLAAIQSKVSSVSSLKQLPPISHRAMDQHSPAVEEIAMQVEIIASTQSASRFLRSLPLRGEELREAGFGDALTNKPAFFIERILVRKHAPNQPDAVRLEARVSSFAPWPPADPIGPFQ